MFLGLYGGSSRLGPRWLSDQSRAPLVTGILTLVFLIGRATGEFSLMKNAAYKPAFTLGTFHAHQPHVPGRSLLYARPPDANDGGAAMVSLAAIAWASQSKALRFAWLFLMLSVAPVAFVEPRGAAQYYIPLFGWALYGAALLTGFTRLLFRPIPEAIARWRAPALMAALLLTLYPFYKAKGHDNVTSVTIDGAMLRSLANQTLALHPGLAAGSRLLVLNETDDPAWDTFLAALRLSYRDDEINFDRARKIDHKLSEPEIARYEIVMDYQNGRLRTHTVRPIRVCSHGWWKSCIRTSAHWMRAVLRVPAKC